MCYWEVEGDNITRSKGWEHIACLLPARLVTFLPVVEPSLIHS